MSAEGLHALREVLTWHDSTQDPALTIECARDALIKLLASEQAQKAKIAELRDRLATAEAELVDARAAGAEAMREAAINMVASWPLYVGYSRDIRMSVESRIFDRDAEIIAAIRQFAA